MIVFQDRIFQSNNICLFECQHCKAQFLLEFTTDLLRDKDPLFCPNCGKENK